MTLPPAERSEAVTWWKRWAFGPWPADRMFLYEELASLTSAGIGIQEAVENLRARSGGRRRRALERLAEAVAFGVPPGEAMARLPEFFPPVEAQIVAAGERTGRLDRSFRDAAAEVDRARQTTAKILRAVAYPVFLLHFALFVPACAVMAIGDKSWGPYLVVWTTFVVFWVAIAIAMTFHVSRRNSAVYGRRIAGIPIFGAVARCAAVSRGMRVAALLHDAGIDLPTSLRSAADASGNGWIASELRTAAANVESGTPAPQSLSVVGALGDDARSLIETGDRTGALDEAFQRISQIESERFDAGARRVAVGVAGLLMAIVALVVFLMLANVLAKWYGPLLKV